MKNDQRKILILGINFSPELTGIGRYTGEMVEWLSLNGYNCTVVTSFPYYPDWKIRKPYNGKFYKKEIMNDGGTIVYRCPFYVPNYPSGIKRILHEFSFFFSAFFLFIYLLFKPKHSMVFCVAPPFHLGFLALFYRFFKGGRIIYHIQDLQIEAAKDLKIIKSDLVFRILFGMERFIIKGVDHVTSISNGMIRKIQIKTSKKIDFFPNWVDTQQFFPLENKKDLKPRWGFQEEDKVILYSGSIGEKQGLESIIDIALRFLIHQNIKFVICGSGPYKEKLEILAKEKGASNLVFLPLQEKMVFNDFLNFADIHLVLQKNEASDLVMPSKLTTILSAGGLVIATAKEGTSLYDDIVGNNMGIVIPPEDNESLFDAIMEACKNDYSEMRLNARKFSETFLNKEQIFKGMKDSILK